MLKWFQGLARLQRLELAALGVVLVALLLAATGLALVPSGTAAQAELPKGWWERAYYVTNALLPLVAIAALVVAREQLVMNRAQLRLTADAQGAQLTATVLAQKAEVYLDLERRWNTLLPWRKTFSAAPDTAKAGESVSAKLDALLLAQDPAGRDGDAARMAGP